MANQRQGVPAGWTWRDGRPRWIPSPALRAAGWKGLDLKDAKGQWLARGPSFTEAEAIMAAVAAWRAGQIVPAGRAAIAPAGAAAERKAPLAPGAMSIGALIDAYIGAPQADPPVPISNEMKTKSAGTIRDYRGKLKRLVDVLAGWPVLPDADATEADRKRYAQDVATARGLSVMSLEPDVDAKTGELLSNPLYHVYWTLHAKAGVHQASGVMACASAWLGWVRKHRNRHVHNWVKEVSRETPPGRIRAATWPELIALRDAADALAADPAKTEVERLQYAAAGDGIVLAVDLSWSEVDLLHLDWTRISGGRAFTARQKTGRKGGTPLLHFGLARLEIIRQRQAALDVQPLRVIYLPRQRNRASNSKSVEGDFFRRIYNAVRSEAAKTVPTVADLNFADLRDTAFSLYKTAGATDDEIASRTLQSRRNIATLGDKAYGEIGPATADAGRDRLNAYLESKGLSL